MIYVNSTEITQLYFVVRGMCVLRYIVLFLFLFEIFSVYIFFESFIFFSRKKATKFDVSTWSIAKPEQQHHDNMRTQIAYTYDLKLNSVQMYCANCFWGLCVLFIFCVCAWFFLSSLEMCVFVYVNVCICICACL